MQFKSIVLLIQSVFLCVSDAQIELNTDEFRMPPDSAKMHAWWHWMAGNISKEGITKDLVSMNSQGIVQASIINIGKNYEKEVDGPKVRFNSPEWVEMFQWSLEEASRLGITIGIQTIDGYSTTGGPWITPEMSMKQYVWSKTSVEGGTEVSIQLPQPLVVEDIYRDVAVIAYPEIEKPNSFQDARPRIVVNKADVGTTLSDGIPKTATNFKKGDVIDLAFDGGFPATKLAIFPYLPFCWDDMGKIAVRFAISSSNDGKNYEPVADVEFIGVNKSLSVPFPETKAKFYRLEFKDNNFVFFDTYPIAEVELLKSDELPAFSPALTSFFEKTAAVFDVNENVFDSNQTNAVKVISENSILDISGFMSPDGRLNWKAPEGRWQVLRFGYTSTGVKTDPSTPEGLGLEADKMDAAAIDLHINSYAKKLIDAAGPHKGHTLKFIMMDSWEAEFQTWSKTFPEEFKKRRGYSVLPWLPVLCGSTVESRDLSEAFLHDFRKTIAELIDRNYYKRFAELCHQNQMELHGEAIYSNWGAYPPLDPLKANQYFDVPMTEFWAEQSQDKLPDYQPADRPKPGFPTSSALAHEKQIIASEAYTSFAHYTETPFDLKPFGDAAYCSGVNQLILHSFVHQPFDRKPGMTLGKFGAHFNRNNPPWEFSRDWLTYQARVQYVLQKGEPVVDVMFFAGDQLPQNFSRSFLKDLPFGYQANACNLDMLTQRAKVVDGRISFGGMQTFPILMLPNSTKMEFKTLQMIARLVHDGAVVYGPKPVEMLSVPEIWNHAGEFKELADSLWGGSGETRYGKGKMIRGKPIGEVLKNLDVLPDLTTERGDPKEIMYIHRKLEDTDVYYVFNQQNKNMNQEILFRVTGKTPEIWNPVNGSVETPVSYSIGDRQTRMPVSFKPYESKIFVFRNEAPEHVIKKLQQSTPAPPKVLDLDGIKTRVEFFPISDEVIAPIEVSELKSLTESGNPAIKYFAGKAKYTINFNVPSEFLTASESILLNPGKFSATAELRLNGKVLAYAWMPDSGFDVTGLLMAENRLEFTVATVCRNRMIGDLIQYGSVKSLWTTAPMESILNKEMPLKPSGWMGPLKVLAYPKQHE